MINAPFNRFNIPHKSGVYLFKNNKGVVIYVGKAIDLFSRVSSYFLNYQQQGKTQSLVERIFGVETIIVESEIEALVLEANLIKKYLPQFNTRLTDDKDYLYIKITKEPFPKIITARKKDLSDARVFFGPFPSASTVRNTLKRLRRVFPWCQSPPKQSCFLDTEGIAKTRLRPCFYYHIGQCPGPCAGKISLKDYNQNIKHFIKFMQGRSVDLIEELENEMERSSKNLEFEKAALIKRIISGVYYLLQPNRVQSYLENPNFLEDQNQKGLLEIQQALKLPTFPQRIECFDVSNIQGRQAAASMVVLTGGEIDKSQYRKFKILISGKSNDYAMMAEAVKRRMKHKEWPYPDLMLLDGGRGQVRAAASEIQNLRSDIRTFGLAKRLEWLYPPVGKIIKLKKSSLALRLLQKVRDEAHRFAITYHRHLRSAKMLT